MLIKLTSTKSNDTVYLEADNIKMVYRSAENILETRIQTDMMAPNGYLTLTVKENPDEVYEAIRNTKYIERQVLR